MQTKADFLFEASWEITNKCGGIYTVISSKARLMKQYYPDYFAIGPLFDKLPLEFTKEEVPQEFQNVFNTLKNQGIKCVFGTWNIKGYPQTILIDGRNLYPKLNEIKKLLWEQFGVDSLNSSYDFNEPILWSWAVGMFIDEFSKNIPNKKVVAHFHEWLSGFGSLYLKSINSRVRTVFTTHATMLGRSISQSGEILKKVINEINPLEKAKQLGIIDKHSTENACANNSDVFTTVSNTTAEECNIFFKRMPDVLPNGLLIDDFPTFEQASFNHIRLKQKLKIKIRSYFFPYQIFDIDNSLIFYFGGRYEYLTKGLNVLSKALGKLNNYLKLSKSDKNVVFLFLVAMDSKGVKKEILENENNCSDLRQFMSTFSQKMEEKIIVNMLSDQEPDYNLEKEDLNSLRLFTHRMKKEGRPPLCSHILPYNEIEDPLLNELKNNGLLNRSEDQVKVISVPSFVDGNDGFLDMPYYDVVNACHLGVFPSLYEPWGYTPLESISFGVPTITSEESGFGKFMQDKLPSSHQGVFIYPWQTNISDAADRIFESMRNYLSFDVHARVACKMNAHKLSYKADWKILINNYINAHNKAVDVPRE